MNHELVRLSALIDWIVFNDRFGELYHAEVGCPGKPTRLMVGVLHLKHLHKLYDEQLVIGWLENPHWQYSCSESHFLTDTTVYLSGQKRGGTARIRRSLKRCQAIESITGHLKTDNWLGRNHIKGTKGDSMDVLLSCAGHNLRLILKRLRDSAPEFFVAQFFIGLFASDWLRREQNSDMQR